MKLHIPHLGAKLTLAADWTFELYCEYRNSSLIAHLKPPYKRLKNADKEDIGYDWYAGHHKPVTLPAGTELTIRRIYIRQGQADFDSVTFTTKLGKKAHRFWVKLADANKIEMVKA